MMRKNGFFLFTGLLFFTIGAFPQNNSSIPSAPQMPQMPAMPTVPHVQTIPAIPSVSPSEPFSPSSTNSPATKSSSTDKSGTSAEKKGLSSLSLIQALTGSGLGGVGDSLDPLSSLLGGGGNSADSDTIQKIQDLLEKAEKAEKAPPAGLTVTAVNSSTVLPTTLPYLERLVINKVNILSTITLVIPSAITSDGSFLLTGERVISVNDGLSEMFYFMCRSQGGNSYLLNVDLTQSKENPQSFLYQLVRKAPLKGEKMGDLLVFRFSEPEWQSDIVIRLPSALVQ